MPTWEEMQAELQGVEHPAERNQRIAQAVQTGALTRSLGGEPMAHTGPERTPAQNRAVFEGHQQELTDEEAAARMTPQPEDAFMGTIRSMAQNYQTSQQYRELLEQELEQISAQIAALTQRRNMIEMAKRGQA
jgi:hypothetical protein